MLCQEWLLRTWTKKAQVDMVGISTMEKTLILGECKWSPNVIDRDVLETLVQKTAEFIPTEGRWRVHYLGFARGGWSREAQAFGKGKAQDEIWTTTGLSLLDLSQVDQDLREWSESKGNEEKIPF